MNKINKTLNHSSPHDAPETLPKGFREADWCTHLDGTTNACVRCDLCPHYCILDNNSRGLCHARVATHNKLYTVAYGNLCAAHVDPIEKKPLNHFLPETRIFSVATAGCNLRCLNCQNWEISQSKPEDIPFQELMPEALVEEVASQKIPSIAYTYSEPLVSYEYTYDSALIARDRGIKNVLVSAGYINAAPLTKLSSILDAANIDLKGFSNVFYKQVSGVLLKPVLRTLEILKNAGVWLEVTHLIIPTLSDDLAHIRGISKWMVQNLGADTPLHISRFYPAHKLKHLNATPIEIIKNAQDIARNAGLNYVYIGNASIPGGQDTICPSCGKITIARKEYTVEYNLDGNGRCSCGHILSGVWSVRIHDK